MELAAHGLSVDVPRGWDGEVFLSQPDALLRPAGARADLQTDGTANAVLQLANFALPEDRGDFGGGAVELMGPTGVLIVLAEFDREAAGTSLFSTEGVPRQIRADEFDPNCMQRPLPGQAGAQWFVQEAGRAFCLYIALGGYRLRNVLVAEANDLLATLGIEPSPTA